MSNWVPLGVEDCDPNPFVQFQDWYDQALGLMPDRAAIALATSTLSGRPSARMVLLRHVDDHGFGWYTNYESHKGEELAVNPHAALLWYNEPQGRQIRIEGPVARMDEAQSDAYFGSRARGHQLGAHASRQSRPLASRRELEDRVCEVEVEFAGRDVPRPDRWGGYCLTPVMFEFWQHREDRLHDRVVYSPDGDGWTRERRSP
ncbi:MAG: pyridoxamine 5'-phosphate oxidase [Acidimicrobiales bacterium]